MRNFIPCIEAAENISNQVTLGTFVTKPEDPPKVVGHFASLAPRAYPDRLRL
jgi:hypothetical protein